MIICNENSGFGKYAALRTSAFDCIISAAPGLIRSTILITALGPDGRAKGWPVAKGYLARGAKREAAHNYIVDSLDELGRDKNHSIGCAIEGAFSVAKARGFIVDYIIAPSAK
jgi:hypothetical protein